LKDHACRGERHAEQQGGDETRQAQVEEQTLGEVIAGEAVEGQEARRRVTSEQGGEEEHQQQGKGEEGEGAFHREWVIILSQPLAFMWLTERQINHVQCKEKTMRFKVVLEASDEGGYTVYVPSLPGCISEGETVDEALKNIQEAIALYLEPVEDDLVMGESALLQEVEL